MTKLLINRRPSPLLLNPLMPTDLWQDFHKTFLDAFNLDMEHPNLRLQKGFPKGDVFLEDGNMVIELLLAGYKKEQLSVKVEDDCLVVSAKKLDETSGEQGKQVRRSAFTKTFPNFNKAWDLPKSEVSYEDGLLRIVVPPFQKEEDKTQELVIK